MKKKKKILEILAIFREMGGGGDGGVRLISVIYFLIHKICWVVSPRSSSTVRKQPPE